MEFLAEAVAERVLKDQLLKARQLRQQQARQQMNEWSEGRRKLLEEEKRKQKETIVNQITEVCQQYATEQIHHLFTAHDLAISGVGTAHRAAEEIRKAEVEKEKKVEEQQILAADRGNMAIGKLLKDRKFKAEQRRHAFLVKQQARKAEDEKTKLLLDLVKRKRAMPSTDIDPVQPSTNPFASSNKINTIGESAPAGGNSRKKLELLHPRKTSRSPSKVVRYPVTSPSKNLKTSKSGPHAALQGTMDHAAKLRHKTNPPVVKSMTRYTHTATGIVVQDSTAKSQSPSQPDGILRTSHGPQKQKLKSSASSTGKVRFLDTSIPQPEPTYLAPTGVGIRIAGGDTGSRSPDAWDKARDIGNSSREADEGKQERQEELKRNTESRGANALTKEELLLQLRRLENEFTNVLQVFEEKFRRDLGSLDTEGRTGAVGPDGNGILGISTSRNSYQTMNSSNHPPQNFGTIQSCSSRSISTAITRKNLLQSHQRTGSVANDDHVNSTNPLQIISGTIRPSTKKKKTITTAVTTKDVLLLKVISEFLARQEESIERLPVSSPSSTDVVLLNSSFLTPSKPKHKEVICSSSTPRQSFSGHDSYSAIFLSPIMVDSNSSADHLDHVTSHHHHSLNKSLNNSRGSSSGLGSAGHSSPSPSSSSGSNNNLEIHPVSSRAAYFPVSCSTGLGLPPTRPPPCTSCNGATTNRVAGSYQKSDERIGLGIYPSQDLVDSGGRSNTSVMPIPQIEAPLKEEQVEQIQGRHKGIQGHRNSCYLDATLFSMFSFSSVFDSILLQDFTHRPNRRRDAEDEKLARNVQKILRDEIVNPLRKASYCSANNVMRLRQTMEHLDPKLTSEEMDPQEFLQLLFDKVLNLEEFMSLSSGQSDFFHQVLVQQREEDRHKIPTIQQLFKQSLMLQELKLKSVPQPALILQMPRSGNKYKMYDGILPNLQIDITDLLEDIPRECIICENLKKSRTRTAIPIKHSFPAALSSTTSLISSIPPPSSHQRSIPRVTMDLFAVICIETSHFVSYVKCGTDRNAPWVFFDSMADRVENANGTRHNIPQVRLLPKMGNWLDELEKQRDVKKLMEEGKLSPELKRLITDPYICLYYSKESESVHNHVAKGSTETWENVMESRSCTDPDSMLIDPAGLNEHMKSISQEIDKLIKETQMQMSFSHVRTTIDSSHPTHDDSEEQEQESVMAQEDLLTDIINSSKLSSEETNWREFLARPVESIERLIPHSGRTDSDIFNSLIERLQDDFSPLMALERPSWPTFIEDSESGEPSS